MASTFGNTSSSNTHIMGVSHSGFGGNANGDGGSEHLPLLIIRSHTPLTLPQSESERGVPMPIL